MFCIITLMGILKESKEWADTLNSYSQAIIAINAAGIVIAAWNGSTLVIALALSLAVISAAAGFILRPIIEEQKQWYGFRIISNKMTYEIKNSNDSKLSYKLELDPAQDHLMMYPIGHNWTGTGAESTPKLLSPNQQIMAPIVHKGGKTTPAKPKPYEANAISVAGNWRYWFVAFNPAVHKGKPVTIEYSQNFHDTKKSAKPFMYYFVRRPMQKLTLVAKFPAHHTPSEVTGSFIKADDPNKADILDNVVYDKHKRCATLTINRPKRGYYRLDWS